MKFFFLLRLEEAHVPEPDIQLGGHELVGLLQPKLALQVHLGIVIHVEDDRRLVAVDIFAEATDKSLRAR